MTNEVIARELEILTKRGGYSLDEAIEFLRKTAAKAKEVDETRRYRSQDTHNQPPGRAVAPSAARPRG